MAKSRKQVAAETKSQVAPDVLGTNVPTTSRPGVVPVRPPRRLVRVPVVEITEDDNDEPEADEFNEDGEADTFDQDEDFLDEDEDENDGVTLPAFPVSNTDPQLVAFLESISKGDRAASLALADRLKDRGDPRAAHARELAEARFVVPEGGYNVLRAAPMACGTWWCIALRPSRVVGIAYWGTPLYLLLASAGRGDVEARVTGPRRSPKQLEAACERCRQSLLLGLFGTSQKLLKARQVVREGADLERVVRTLEVHQAAAVPWLLELREVDADRFEKVLARILESKELLSVGQELLDAACPGWRQRLSAAMTQAVSRPAR